MARRKTIIVQEPYHLNPEISFIDFYFNGELITAGTDIRIKNDRRVYRFIRMCYNSKIDREWVDLRSPNGDWKSVYPAKIKGLAQRKKSIRKKK